MSLTANRQTTVFAFLWAASELFHRLTFLPLYAGRFEWLAAPFLLAIGYLLFRPSSLWGLAALAGCNVLFTLYKSVGVNHIVFTSFCNMTILGVILTHRDQKLSERLSALLRLELLILYFFAVLHKLNSDYFDPEISCAVTLLVSLAERFPFIPINDTIKQLSIWGTLGAEAGIPLLFLFKRTRYLGLLLGLSSHFILGVHPYKGLYSFTAMLYALFFLFAPSSFTEHLCALKKNLLAWRTLRVFQFSSAFVLLALSYLYVFRPYPPVAYQVWQWAFYFWLPWTMVALGVFAVVAYAAFKRPLADEPQSFRPALCLWLAIPLYIVFHSFNPYLGLKTTPCLSMFSNLRTEGRTNHLFVPESWKLAHFQEDLVEVSSSTDGGIAKLTEGGTVIPYVELQRRVMVTPPPLTVEFLRGDQRLTAQKLPDGTLVGIEPVSWLEDKYLRFRAVPKSGPMKCSH